MSKGAEIPSLSSGWSENLNDVMRWCLEKDTWNRAKASQIREISEAVLNADQEISVAELISRMIGKKQASSTRKTQQKNNSHATNPYVGNEFFSESNNKEVPVLWWKRPVVWIVSAGIVALIVIAVNVLPRSHEEVVVKPGPIVEDASDKNKPSSVDKNIPFMQDERIPVDKSEKNDFLQPERPPHPIKQSSQGIGTLDLGYATWHGNIINGKPDGKGTMTFTTTHRIDSRDSDRRMAKAGERIEGNYMNGHLDEGRWFKSDGSTEYIMLGE